MEQARFWSRVGLWFKKVGQSSRSGRDEPYGDFTDEAGVAGPEVPPDALDEAAPAELARSDSKLRPARPAPTMERLAEEYARVVKLMDAIETHMASQDARSERVASALEQLAGSIGDQPQATQKQLDVLNDIRETVAAEAEGTRRVEEELAQLPNIADAQREAMVSIERQLDHHRETSAHIGSAVGDVGQALSGLCEVTDASTKTLEHMRSDSAARDERLALLVEEHSRRFSAMAWWVIGLAGIVAVTGLIALFR